jgi:hypothetical protein
MVSEHEQLSTSRMLLGLAAASVVGLASYVFLLFGADLLQAAVAAVISGHEWEATNVSELAAIYLVFGWPVALILSLAVGYPVWKRADSRPFRSARAALSFGAVVGALIGLGFTILTLVVGLRTYLDHGTSFDSWSYGYQVTRDGLPTLIGWAFELLNILYLAAAGAIGGLTARRVALPR